VATTPVIIAPPTIKGAQPLKPVTVTANTAPEKSKD
jgi:hypothetical protein